MPPAGRWEMPSGLRRLAILGGLGVTALAAFSPTASASTAPEINTITGTELTTANGVFITQLDRDDSVSIVRSEDKTMYVGVRRAGDTAISLCGFISKWEKDKYDQPTEPVPDNNPCTVERMNQLKTIEGAGKDPNCFTGCIDGTFYTPVIKERPKIKCNPIIYREYKPKVSAPAYVDTTGTKVKPGFHRPVTINHDDQRVARIKNSVHYRVESYDGDAALIRFHRQDLKGMGLSKKLLKKLKLWGWVDRNCMPHEIKMNSPKKHRNARRGHHPHGGKKHTGTKDKNQSSDTAQASSLPL